MLLAPLCLWVLSLAALFAHGQQQTTSQFLCDSTNSVVTTLTGPNRPSTVGVFVAISGPGGVGATITPNPVYFQPNSSQVQFTVSLGGSVTGMANLTFTSTDPSYSSPNDVLEVQVSCVTSSFWHDNGAWVGVLIGLGVAMIILALVLFLRMRALERLASVSSTKRAVTSVIGSVRRVENVEMDGGEEVSRNVIDNGPPELDPLWDHTIRNHKQVVGAQFHLDSVIDNLLANPPKVMEGGEVSITWLDAEVPVMSNATAASLRGGGVVGAGVYGRTLQEEESESEESSEEEEEEGEGGEQQEEWDEKIVMANDDGSSVGNDTVTVSTCAQSSPRGREMVTRRSPGMGGGGSGGHFGVTSNPIDRNNAYTSGVRQSPKLPPLSGRTNSVMSSDSGVIARTRAWGAGPPLSPTSPVHRSASGESNNNVEVVVAGGVQSAVAAMESRVGSITPRAPTTPRRQAPVAVPSSTTSIADAFGGEIPDRRTAANPTPPRSMIRVTPRIPGGGSTNAPSHVTDESVVSRVSKEVAASSTTPSRGSGIPLVHDHPALPAVPSTESKFSRRDLQQEQKDVGSSGGGVMTPETKKESIRSASRASRAAMLPGAAAAGGDGDGGTAVTTKAGVVAKKDDELVMFELDDVIKD